VTPVQRSQLFSVPAVTPANSCVVRLPTRAVVPRTTSRRQAPAIRARLGVAARRRNPQRPPAPDPVGHANGNRQRLCNESQLERPAYGTNTAYSIKRRGDDRRIARPDAHSGRAGIMSPLGARPIQQGKSAARHPETMTMHPAFPGAAPCIHRPESLL
jgi:hypothetical protein